MSNQLTLGEKIKLARTKKGLKQSDLSNLLGIRNTTVSSWDNNQSKPDINILESLHNILEVNPNYFFNLDNKDNMTIKELELLKKYKMLDERGKNLIDILLNTELTFNIRD